jgi:hypothetical protein
MGQRLVLSIKKDDVIIANSYYHWSGYTFPSIDLALTVYNYIEANRDIITNPYELAIRALKQTGANYADKKTIDIAQKLIGQALPSGYPDRNKGLISLSTEDVISSLHWAEVDVIVDIDSDMIYVDAYHIETLESLSNYKDITDKDIPTINNYVLDNYMHISDLLDLFENLTFKDTSTFKINNTDMYLSTI